MLAAIGLILLALTKHRPHPGAVGRARLAIVMIGAMVVHGRRREPQMIAVNAVLLVLALVVVVGRFGPVPSPGEVSWSLTAGRGDAVRLRCVGDAVRRWFGRRLSAHQPATATGEAVHR